ncbi:hypothetical protein Dimus_021307, partial [Dionaea muscipula]
MMVAGDRACSGDGRAAAGGRAVVIERALYFSVGYTLGCPSVNDEEGEQWSNSPWECVGEW